MDLSFSEEIKRYGSEDFYTCYSCGNCTAVCSLTEKNANFPRMMIRHGMLGLKDEILSSKELWLCYACGDCTETCPRQADPGHYMAALRRYAIAYYEPTGLTRLIFKSNPFAIVLTIILSFILGLFLFTLKPDHEVARWIFKWLPFDVVHDMGMVIFILTGISMVIGLFNMFRHLSGKNQPAKERRNSFFQIMRHLADEFGTFRRYQKCDREEESFWQTKPWYVRPWAIHWTIMWGFLGLLAATTLDFIFKDPAMKIWWPSRILGTVAGLLMMYGATLALWYRFKRITKSYSESHLADWMFLGFLWVAGLTGFWLEIAVAFDSDSVVNHVTFLIHTVISMELVLLFAFSKFAHAIYRPLALFFYFREKG